MDFENDYENFDQFIEPNNQKTMSALQLFNTPHSLKKVVVDNYGGFGKNNGFGNF